MIPSGLDPKKLLAFIALAVCIVELSLAKHESCQKKMEIEKTSGAIEVYLDSLYSTMEDTLGRLRGKLKELEAQLYAREDPEDNRDEEKSCLSLQRRMPENCAEIFLQGEDKDGVYQIWPRYFKHPITVYCDMKTNGGGWTVFQRRNDYGEPRQNFFLEWEEYKRGFGNVSQEFWLGNDALFALTSQDRMVLRIELEDFNQTRRYATYDDFIVRSEHELYRMTFSSYSGDAGDSLQRSKDSAFSTKDRKNDVWERNCAEVFKGGWWYKECHDSNLNGLYLKGPHTSFADGVNWRAFRGYNYSLKFTEMKIRPKNFISRRR